MTAPDYKDKDRVEGLLLSSLLSQSEEALIEKKSMTWEDSAHNTRVRLARTARALWRERDKARETAALQDAEIHKMVVRLYRLEKLWAAIKQEGGHTEMKRRAITALMAQDLGGHPVTSQEIAPVD